VLPGLRHCSNVFLGSQTSVDNGDPMAGLFVVLASCESRSSHDLGDP
jgi:hypothetical protein